MIDTAADAVLWSLGLVLSETFTHVLCRLRVSAGAARYSQVTEARPDGGGHCASVDVFQLGCALQSSDDAQAVLAPFGQTGF